MPLPSFRENSIDPSGKAIPMTGGTGSFGRRSVRTVLKRQKPSRLIIFSPDELKQYRMAQEFSGDQSRVPHLFIDDGDVTAVVRALPLFPVMADQDVDRVVDVLGDILQSAAAA